MTCFSKPISPITHTDYSKGKNYIGLIHGTFSLIPVQQMRYYQNMNSLEIIEKTSKYYPKNIISLVLLTFGLIFTPVLNFKSIVMFSMCIN